MNNILISVIGPTAIGKTKLAILFAQHFGTEILSADSRQFYREMDIGTAVPSKEERNEAQHHFIQHKSIKDVYSVGEFERDAIRKLTEVFKKQPLAIMVGGSGLYVDAVTQGLDKFPKVDAHIRSNLNELFEKKGISALQTKLKKLDPDYFDKADVHNPHRLIRALEICIGTGKPYSSFLDKPKPKREFKVLSVGLRAERGELYERINKRVDIMIAEGLLEEANRLFPYRTYNALQTVGYRELFEYFDGKWELDFAVSEIKKNTRRFAKRQITWFKRNKDTLWLDNNYDKGEALQLIESELNRLKNE
ncbi:tRNA (adenosine(37)-N6)-dimethylallyltransferase MiaA [Maribacter sp. 2304DJ31-5]|uniref:tRNA (adenosine(37)-N6)-dimethylallyltransferase MiaA n=1 Tax=Maribacter sp. 2304DJ31-5 TaxID=3386273 RepID=UPI0039BCDB8A